MVHEDCVFCNIIKGDIPAAKVYEDEKVFAFLDIAPAQKGHTLVIPKVHYESFMDMPKEELSAVMEAVKKIAPAVVEGSGAEAFNLGVNNGEAAGQVVMHAHFHIIPRKKDDGLQMWSQGKYEPEEMEEYKNRILAVL
ncbi:HIT domain-containing protein [Candidatus Woesearchaeota archaeon]|nr:HIT domain-containing protein [Candidatus Woesearchaeota archaeon]